MMTLMTKVVDLTNKLVVADPTDRTANMGPVVNKAAYRDYQTFCGELSQAGRILTGGKVLTDGAFANGYFCAPTIAADVPVDHHLWKDEMFLPIAMAAPVDSLDEGMARANNVMYGLTAGFLRFT